MHRKNWFVLTIAVVLSGLLAIPTAAQISTETARLRSLMPPNPDKIVLALIERGMISATASSSEKEAAVQAYLQLKMKDGGANIENNPLARKLIDMNEEALNNYAGEITGHKLGNTEEVAPSTPEFRLKEGSDDTLLLILVEFSDEPYTWQPVEGSERTEAGPLHNAIPLPDNDFDLWVEDFSTQHYEDMLFTPGGWTFSQTHPYYAGEHRGSMYDYYLEQSYGDYEIAGDAYGWFTVDKPEAYYGDDHPAGGSDNLLPGTTKDLIADAIAKVNETGSINWLDYDLLDLYDMDMDGDINEPDCIIDHPLFIHAGIDQSGGGGAQGDDALWAHSASVWEQVSEETRPGAVCDWGYTILYNYTIMPEDGGVGVFAHEFGHDLGLPDEYDTIYSGGGSSEGFWTLMASGSWVGRPAQTQPSDISIWGRMVLGWVREGENMAVTHIDDLSRDPTLLRLEQAERWAGEGTLNAIRVNLPDKYFYVNDPYSGSLEWFGGKADQIDTTLRHSIDLTGKSSAELSFWTWYDIEEGWDYGFVQISEDGGTTWTSLPLDGTTSDHDPGAMDSIVANLPGFTGSSGGWVQKTFDLSGYSGQTILLQFRYMTDWATSMAGFYLDDISVSADGSQLFFDDAETLDPGWSVDGWTQEAGSGTKEHYYMMEWRNLNPFVTDNVVNFDAGLSSVYQFDPYSETPNQPYYFSYSPGLLLYYRDATFTDNWTGSHPGGGFLLIVDAHNRPLLAPASPGSGSLVWNTRVQSYDAAFSLERAPELTIGYWGDVRTYLSSSAVPNFDDQLSYWNNKTPSASVQTPTLGLLFRILGQAEDGSAALLGLGTR